MLDEVRLPAPADEEVSEEGEHREDGREGEKGDPRREPELPQVCQRVEDQGEEGEEPREEPGRQDAGAVQSVRSEVVLQPEPSPERDRNGGVHDENSSG
jgi:hypothetical protein